MRIHISDLDIASGWSDAIKNRRNLLLEETYESRHLRLEYDRTSGGRYAGDFSDFHGIAGN